MAAVYLGDDVYVEDEETVTRIFVHADRSSVRESIDLRPEVAQRLFDELVKTRGTKISSLVTMSDDLLARYERDK